MATTIEVHFGRRIRLAKPEQVAIEGFKHTITDIIVTRQARSSTGLYVRLYGHVTGFSNEAYYLAEVLKHFRIEGETATIGIGNSRVEIGRLI